jgi:hypothetical protein
MPYQSTTSGAHTLHTFLQMFYTFNPATCSVSFAELQTFSFIHTWKVVCRYRSQSFRHALLHNTFATVANRWGCRCDSHYCIQIPGKSLTSYNRDSAQAKVLLIALSVRRKVHDLCSPRRRLPGQSCLLRYQIHEISPFLGSNNQQAKARTGCSMAFDLLSILFLEVSRSRVEELTNLLG